MVAFSKKNPFPSSHVQSLDLPFCTYDSICSFRGKNLQSAGLHKMGLEVEARRVVERRMQCVGQRNIRAEEEGSKRRR